jgi:hypothetical protein
MDSSQEQISQTVPQLYEPLDDKIAEQLLSEGFSELIPQPTESVHIERRIYAIQKFEEEMTSLEKQRQSSSDFYQSRIEQAQRGIDIMKTQIMWYLQQNNMNKIPTPYGTAFITKRKKITWPDDESLLKFATDKCMEAVKVKTVTTVDKNTLKSYIESSGIVPENYVVTPTESLSIRS